MFSLICLVILVSVCAKMHHPLDSVQQKSIRRILANPNTPLMIRVKTKNIVYEKYHVWSQNICAEYLKKRSYSELRPDLEQCISSGLLAAIDRYDWTRETSFPNYAKKYVLGALVTGIEKLCRTRNEVSFVAPKNGWIFDKCVSNSEDPREPQLSKHDILMLLDPEERRLFEYVYGHVFEGGTAKHSVAEICDLMAYGNRETMRLRKTRMFKKLVRHMGRQR